MGRGTTKNLQVLRMGYGSNLAGDERGRDLLHLIESQLSASQLAGAREQAHKLER
jgi:hypothetical protein